jgi:hypothetical protein
MEEAPENDKEPSHSAHANGVNEWKTLADTVYKLPEDGARAPKHVGSIII